MKRSETTRYLCYLALISTKLQICTSTLREWIEMVPRTVGVESCGNTTLWWLFQQETR